MKLVLRSILFLLWKSNTCWVHLFLLIYYSRTVSTSSFKWLLSCLQRLSVLWWRSLLNWLNLIDVFRDWSFFNLRFVFVWVLKLRLFSVWALTRLFWVDALARLALFIIRSVYRRWIERLRRLLMMRRSRLKRSLFDLLHSFQESIPVSRIQLLQEVLVVFALYTFNF